MNSAENNSPKRSFWRSSILMNIVYILVAGVVFVWLALLFVDLWTNHGDERVVPNVKGMAFEKAENLLRSEGFTVEIADSVYESTEAPGTVIEQIPRVNAKVKPGRLIYVTIVAFSPRTVTVPDLSNVSLRQARSIFESLGVKKLHVVEVESEYEGLLINAKYNGLPLSAGARIPVNAAITLEVGKGLTSLQLDSLQLDSIAAATDLTIENLDLE